jgi:hypothetical protein
MKILNKLAVFVIFIALTTACETDKDLLYSLDYITAPANVSGVFDITQDNTGLVTIVPNAEGAQKFSVIFGDGSTTPAECLPGGKVTHTYKEGKYMVKIKAIGITGLETESTQELNVTFKAPQNLKVTIANDDQNPRIVRISATADFVTVFEVYFGEKADEEPQLILPGNVAEYTYAGPGSFNVKVVAKSAGAATSVFNGTAVVPEAADPVKLPVDFESFTVNYAFGNFGNAFSSVVDNPDKSGLNTSARVGKTVKSAGAETWAGSLLTLESPINFTTLTNFKVKVWSPKSGAVVKLKVENLNSGDISHEVDATTTKSDQWEELTFDFSKINKSQEYQKVVIFFDFGNTGDGSAFYFDDIRQTAPPTGFSPLAGTWKIAPEAGAIGVGPNLGDVSWWASSADDVTGRACYFDDTYVFGLDGSFSNVLGGQTWIEGWQGGTDACGTPVAPHDGTAIATYAYNQAAGTVTLNGKGAYLGLAKVFNGGELASPANAPNSITYNVTLSDNDNRMTLDINIGGGWWRFKLVKDSGPVLSPLVGTWQMAPEAGALGVGPGLGDTSWWASGSGDVTGRACFFDDSYIFKADGTFANVLGSETWIEGWQGGLMPVARLLRLITELLKPLTCITRQKARLPLTEREHILEFQNHSMAENSDQTVGCPGFNNLQHYPYG